MSKATAHFRVRVRKPGAFDNFHVVHLSDLTEGAKAVVGRRGDGSAALQSVEFDAVEWPDRGAAREWVKKNRGSIEESLSGGAMEHELGEDIFRPGSIPVDRENGVLCGAKLLGAKSENGYVYTDNALQDAARLYEGIKVNLDHPDRKAPDTPRSVADRFGKVTGVKVVPGDGVYGDVAYNPKHPLTESILWFAEHMPDALGFSQNGRGALKRRGSETVVESVRLVRHVDLVTDPATTRSLFESKLEPFETLTPDDEDTTGDDMEFDKLTLEQLRSKRPDLVDSLLQESKQSAEAKKELVELREERDTLKKENDEFKVSTALAQKKEKVDEVLKESKLPDEAITDTFRATLMEAKDEEAMKALVEDRKKLVLNSKPKSRETTPLTEGKGAGGEKPTDAKSFAAAVKRR